MTTDEIFRKQEFWELVVARNSQLVQDFKSEESSDFQNHDYTAIISSDFGHIESFKTDSGLIKYSGLVKEFPLLSKSQRGKSGGTLYFVKNSFNA